MENFEFTEKVCEIIKNTEDSKMKVLSYAPDNFEILINERITLRISKTLVGIL